MVRGLVGAGRRPHRDAEHVSDVVERKRAHPARRQLEGQRNAIGQATELGDRLGHLRRHSISAVDGPRPVSEQPHRRGGEDGRCRWVTGATGARPARDGERMDPPHALVTNPERPAARGQNLELTRTREHRPDERRTAGQDVFAVVEDEQLIARSQALGQIRHGSHLTLQIGCRGDGTDHVLLAASFGQRHEPDPVSPPFERLAPGLDRQPCLSEARSADDGDDLSPAEDALELCQLPFPSHEARRRGRQAVRRQRSGL